MKIEALETIKSDGYVLDAGDVKTQVPEAIGSKWCALGWAKDLDGNLETGERQVLNAKLTVANGLFVAKAANAGVN